MDEDDDESFYDDDEDDLGVILESRILPRYGDGREAKDLTWPNCSLTAPALLRDELGGPGEQV
jgi:hypothetical protein